MMIFDHWLIQKEKLPALAEQQQDLSGVIYQIRHALLQTEQNALAEMQDDVLRQQAGVLFSCVKNSIGLIEAHIAAQVWVPQKAQKAPAAFQKKWLPPLVLFLIAAALCVLRSEWLVFASLTAASVLAVSALLHTRKENAAFTSSNETRISLKPDLDKLLGILDGQVRAVERYLNDFSYLNEQLRGSSDCSDPAAVSRASDLLEALYECDETERGPADEAARLLLESLGLRALDYSEENSHYFNALPSKNTTRTLSPAILSIKDQRLLRRGTAAVRIEAA